MLGCNEYGYWDDETYDETRKLMSDFEHRYVANEKKEYLKALNLKTFHGFELYFEEVNGHVFNRVIYNGDSQSYIIQVRVKEEQKEEYYKKLSEEGFNDLGHREYILLVCNKPIYVFLYTHGYADGMTVNLSAVRSDCFTEEDAPWIKQLIAKYSYVIYSGGPEYLYSDDKVFFRLGNKEFIA